MEKMFGTMMQGLCSGMSESDRQKMKVCCEKMTGMGQCGSIKDMPEADKQAMKEKMMSFCSGKMGMMSSFFEGSRSAK